MISIHIVLYTIGVCAEKEFCATHFSANLSVYYIVDGLKGDLKIVLMSSSYFVKTT